MKRTLILPLILTLTASTVAPQSVYAIEKTQTAKVGLALATGPALYGMFLGARKLGMKNCKVISKGILTAALTTFAVGFASAINDTAYLPQNILGSALCGLGACALGKSLANDLRDWNITQ